jgi:hypothetical protein
MLTLGTGEVGMWKFAPLDVCSFEHISSPTFFDRATFPKQLAVRVTQQFSNTSVGYTYPESVDRAVAGGEMGLVLQ